MNCSYLKGGLAVFVLCLLVCSPVQKNTDTTLLMIQRGNNVLVSPILEESGWWNIFSLFSIDDEEVIFILTLLYRAEM